MHECVSMTGPRTGRPPAGITRGVRASCLAAAVVCACIATGRPGWAEDRITAFVETDGRVVFTNLATYTPPSRPTGPATSRHMAPRGTLDALIESIAARHGVDPTLVRAVIEVESSFDRDAVSPKGALGLMQLIPATGRRFGVRDFFDPAQNLEGGVRYLRFLLEKFEGNLDLSLAAYNSGENRVERLGRIPAIPETQDYVRKVRSAYRRMGGGGAAYRPAVALAGVAATEVTTRQATATRPVAEGSAPRAALRPGTGLERGPAVIHRSLDDRGIMRFSNVDSVE